MRIELPFPPSTNTYWRHVPNGRSVKSMISAGGRKYCRVVAKEVMMQRASKGLYIQAFILALFDNPKHTREAILSVWERNGKTFVCSGLINERFKPPEHIANLHQIVTGAHWLLRGKSGAHVQRNTHHLIG